MERDVMLALERIQTQIDRLSARVPVRLGSAVTAVVDRWVQIIGGNPLASGFECIQYAPSVTPLALYDPDVDTSYPTGLGNGWLWEDGERIGRVLVVHDYEGDQTPADSGRPVAVNGTTTLTYGSDTMTAYRVHWL
jgi:hypothetical protein